MLAATLPLKPPFMSDSLPLRILVTGGAGFLGQALLSELKKAGFAVRAFDVVPVPESHADGVEIVVGDVADAESVDRACTGCDALVMAHMAPNRPGVYVSSGTPFDINVKGCALLFEAAVKHGLKRVVLISSISVVDGHRANVAKLTNDLPACPVALYGLTKCLQEEIAAYHHRQSGLSVAILRPAYVTDEDTLTDKYGNRRPSVNWQFIDRRDVAGAAVAALRANGLTFGRYFVHGHPGAAEKLGVEATRAELGWSPKHTFSAYPDDAA